MVRGGSSASGEFEEDPTDKTSFEFSDIVSSIAEFVEIVLANPLAGLVPPSVFGFPVETTDAPIFGSEIAVPATGNVTFLDISYIAC